MAISLSGLDLSFLKDSPLPSPVVVVKSSKVDLSKRSHLAAPRIIHDRVEYKSMRTGEMITSRRNHRDHLKRHELVELGDISAEGLLKEKAKGHAEARKEFAKGIKDDVRKAVQMHEQGYRSNLREVASESISYTTDGKVTRSVPVPQKQKFII